jgi:hypothetical protein
MANPLEELRDMTLRELVDKLNLSDDDFEEWLKVLKIVKIHQFSMILE